MVADDERIRPERFVVQSDAEIEVISIGPPPEEDKTSKEDFEQRWISNLYG